MHYKGTDKDYRENGSSKFTVKEITREFLAVYYRVSKEPQEGDRECTYYFSNSSPVAIAIEYPDKKKAILVNKTSMEFNINLHKFIEANPEYTVKSIDFYDRPLTKRMEQAIYKVQRYLINRNKLET